MRGRVATVSFLVRDYDEALSWFTRCLRFRVLEDSRLSADKRWVVVAPPLPDGTQPSALEGATLLLARAATEEQRAAVGRQAGGRVFLFLHTDDFARDKAHMESQGVRFVEGPRQETYGTVAVFLDLYGNRWDLIQPPADP